MIHPAPINRDLGHDRMSTYCCGANELAISLVKQHKDFSKRILR